MYLVIYLHCTLEEASSKNCCDLSNPPMSGWFWSLLFPFYCISGSAPPPRPLRPVPLPHWHSMFVLSTTSFTSGSQVSACTRPGARNSLPPSAVHSLFRQHQQGRLLNSSSGSRQDVKRINKQISEWRGHLSPSCFFSLVLTLSFQITRITNIYWATSMFQVLG